MLSRAAIRTAAAAARTPTSTALVSRRALHATRARMGGHYKEGPLSNLPFNPRSKWFPLGYWTFMATGFFLPFGIAVMQTYRSADA